MEKNIYDEKGFLKPEYMLTDAEKDVYYDSMKIDTSMRDSMITYKGKDVSEYQTSEDLERANKAYFDYLNQSFNINDPHMDRAVFQANQERILAYIHERYENYFENLLEQYGYGSKSSEKGPRK